MSRKDDRLELKKTENLISFIDSEGREIEKSVKVNEIDSLVPELLALSPAILQYVCFCHQDDSLWPFDDSSTLKKVFDQIFNTEQFSKMQENMKKFIKDKKNKLKEKKEQLLWLLKQVKDDQDTLESLKNCRIEVENIRELLQENKDLLILKDAELVQEKSKETGFFEMLKKKEEVDKYQEFLSELGECRHIDDFEGLMKEEQEIISRVSQLEDRKSALEKNFSEVEVLVREKQDARAKVLAQIEVINEQNVKDLEIRRGLEELLRKTENFTLVADEYKKVKQNLADNKNEMSRFQGSLKNEIIHKENEKERIQADIESTLKSLETLPTPEEIQKELNFSHQYLQSSEEMIENHNKTIKALKQNIDIQVENSKISSEIQENNKIHREKSSKLSEITSFFLKLSEAIPSLKHLPFIEYESQLKLYSNTIESEKIQQLTTKNELESLILQQLKEIENNQNQIILLKEQESSTLRDSLQMASDLKLNFNNFSELEDLVMVETTKLKDLQDIETETLLVATKTLMNRSIIAKKCEICENLVQDSKITDRLEKIEKKLLKVKDVNDKSSLKKVKFHALIELFSIQKDLKTRITRLEVRNSSLLQENLKQKNLLEYQVAQLTGLAQKSTEVVQYLQSVSRYSEVISNSLQLSLNLKLADLRTLSFPVKDTPHKSAKKDLDTLKQSLEDCESEIMNLIMQKQQYQIRSQELEAKQVFIQQERERLSKILSFNENKMSEVESYIEELHAELQIVLVEYPGRINRLKEEKNRLKHLISTQKSFSLLQNQLTHTSGLLNKLLQEEKETSSTLSELNNQIINIQYLQAENNTKIIENQGKLQQIKSSLKFEQNLRMAQEMQKKVKILNEEISSLFSKFSSFSQEKLETLENLILQLKVEKGKLEQTLLLKSQQLQTLESKNPKSELSAISLSAEVESLDLGLNEYNSVMNALESSIIAYHKEKINEINSIIAKLWSETYKGRDIEKICINADIDKTSKRSSFSYRIAFWAKGQEVDMRGRCSSGQRMMASLVIRIALAQAFSGSFTLIALDEPTTNMDVSNSEGLAECIAQLSANNERLQIVIITHDMDFMRKIIRESPRESYLMIQKTRETSKILQVKCNK
jgi:DNA repair protein RAD50